jgi:hypothetical protein
VSNFVSDRFGYHTLTLTPFSSHIGCLAPAGRHDSPPENEGIIVRLGQTVAINNYQAITLSCSCLLQPSCLELVEEDSLPLS